MAWSCEYSGYEGGQTGDTRIWQAMAGFRLEAVDNVGIAGLYKKSPL